MNTFTDLKILLGGFRSKAIKSFYSGVFALMLLAGFSNSAKSQKVNFSGLWKVDSLKSNFRGFVAAVKIKIEQTTDTISIRRTMRTGRSDIRSFTDKLPLDGKTMTNTNGANKSFISIKWSGQALVEKSRYQDDSNNAKYQATETWTLSPDSKTLKIDRLIEDDGNGGQGTSKEVYRRE
jgi:hypothetical protein